MRDCETLLDHPRTSDSFTSILAQNIDISRNKHKTSPHLTHTYIHQYIPLDIHIIYIYIYIYILILR